MCKVGAVGRRDVGGGKKIGKQSNTWDWRLWVCDVIGYHDFLSHKDIVIILFVPYFTQHYKCEKY